MSMQILQVFTNAILLQALQAPSLASALLFLLAEYLLCGAHSFSQKLSQAMHTLLLIHSLLLEVVPAIGLQKALVATIHARVFEDNNGAFLLAMNQHITHHTEYYLDKICMMMTRVACN
jgi:hypothetical protein